MADFSALKTSIQNYIKQNGNEEITGNLLQQVLLSMVTTLGDSAINDLVTALNAEIANRGDADTTLQENINSEATTRANADTELGGSITTLQRVVNGIKANVENGYVYAGIATPSTTPVSGKVFYLALTAGTYTNFGRTVVPQGINILKYNGSAWSLDSFLGLDDVPTQGSNNLVKSGGVLDSIIKDGSAFDLSAYNNGTTYADLNAALTALNALPAAYKKGGMSMKFVQTSDNKYVQFRLVSDSFNTTPSNWQKSGAEVSVSQNTETGHTDINVGGTDYPVASVEEVSQLGQDLSKINDILEISETIIGTPTINQTWDNCKLDGTGNYVYANGYSLVQYKGISENQYYKFTNNGTGTWIQFATNRNITPQSVAGEPMQNFNGYIKAPVGSVYLVISYKTSQSPSPSIQQIAFESAELENIKENTEENIGNLEQEINRLNETVYNMLIDLSDNTNIIRGPLENNLTGDFTILLWGKITNFGYPNFFVTFQQNASGWNYPYRLGEVTFYDEGNTTNGKLTVLVGTGTSSDFSKSLSRYSYTPKDINMFAVVRDSTNATLKFYVNGELVKTITSVPSDIYLHKNLQIMNGNIANLMVVDDVFTDSEIVSAYSFGQKYNVTDTELNIKPKNVVGNKVYDGENAFTAISDILIDYDVAGSNGDSYGGIITPSSYPIPNKYWYIAKQAGIYTNFGITIDNPGVYIVKMNGESYSVDTIWVNYDSVVDDIVTEDIYILKDTDFLLYSDAIINGLDRGLESPINYYVEYLCAIGKVTNRGFLVNASTEQTQTLTIKVYSVATKQIVKTITTTLHIVGDDFAGKSGNILVIGDSTEAGNKYTSPMYSFLQNHNGEGIVFVGTQGDAGSQYKDEGYGGATFSTFISAGNKKLYLGLSDDNTEQFHVNSKYQIVVNSSTIRFELKEINKSTPGSYYVSGTVIDGNIDDVPSSGVMQKYDGTGSETLTYISKEVKSTNPFWNVSTEQFDMSYYKTQIGVQSIKIAFVILGINDIFWGATTVVNNAISLYENLITGCDKVVMVLTTDCANSQSAFGNHYGASVSADNISYKNKIFAIRKGIIQEFQNNQSRPNAYVCMLGGTIDRFYGYNHASQQVPYYSNETEIIQGDSKHPNTNGHIQGGMSLLGILRNLL